MEEGGQLFPAGDLLASLWLEEETCRDVGSLWSTQRGFEEEFREPGTVNQKLAENQKPRIGN